MEISIASIEMDVSIQCRASISTGTVNDYAAALCDGCKFPPIVAFGTDEKVWIGDGWHRVMAVQQVGFDTIEADLRPGGRIDALKYALGANAIHGQRRTNEDKRRCVEIALREFPNLTDSAIAQMCGVSHPTVAAVRPVSLKNLQPEKRTGSDGKQYPATRAKKVTVTDETNGPKKEGKHRAKATTLKYGPPRIGLDQARLAIIQLEQIDDDDAERADAFALVRRWLDENDTRTGSDK